MDRGNSNKLNDIRDIELKYGTIFEFTAGHQVNLKSKEVLEMHVKSTLMEYKIQKT